MDDNNKNRSPNEHASILHDIEREPSPAEWQTSALPIESSFAVASSGRTTQQPIQTQRSMGSMVGQVKDAEYQPGLDSPPVKKPSKWRHVFIMLGVLQLLGVTIFFGIMIWASEQAKQGVSGTEFIALLLLVTLVPAVGIVAFLNFIGLPIYLLKQKPKGKRLALGVISLIISTVLVAYAGYNAFQMYVVLPDYTNDLEEQSRVDAERYAAEREKASYEISKEEAISLLRSCTLKGFYYTAQTQRDGGAWGELSETGVVLTEVENKPYRVSIADRLIPELVPIARESQKVCGGPQFWHDGDYEQFTDGKWYFGTQVVNAAQSGKSKDEALAFMKGCKADYFVGFTDISRVKDANTKSWLEKAEESSSGIEISEDTKSYVFVSKSMTLELQDAARLARAACYGTKKLYVTIDDWIETEYPIGIWKRMKI